MVNQRQSDRAAVSGRGARTVPAMAAVTAAVIALVVYMATLPPDLTWANHGLDGGELITASYTLGVPHPPGYPTYVLLGRLFALLPVGSIAFRYHLFSAVCAAVAAGFVTAITGHPRWVAGLQRLPGRKTIFAASLAAGLSLAFMPLVWGQAIIAEVYTLHLALLAAFLWLLLTGRSTLATGVVYGLALSAHLTALLMLPLALAYRPPRQWLRLLAGTALGLLPIFLPPLLAAGNSPVVWSDPTTPAGWWWLVSARIYRPNLFSWPLDRWSMRLAAWGVAFPAQFSWVGLAVLAAGMVKNWQARRRFYLVAGGTALLYALYAFGYDAPDAAVFFLPGLLLLSILLADGLYLLRGAALLLPLLCLVLNFAQLNLHNEVSPGRLATDTLNSLPPEALVITPGNQTIFTLWYVHHVEEIRPDLILVDSNLFAFDWYRRRLGSQYTALAALQVDDVPAFRRANNHRPVCEVDLDPQQVDCTPAGSR